MKKEPQAWAARKQAVLTAILKSEAGWLGFTEPTLCGRAGVRLHEGNPTSTEEPAPHSSSDLILKTAEFAQSQYTLGMPERTGKLLLPRIVQYDLAHLTEALPETRAGAAADRQHSFLKRSQAEHTLLDHLSAFHNYEVLPCLAWHAFHPIHDDKSLDQLPDTDPFAATKQPNEAELLRALADHIHLSEADWPTALSADEMLVIATHQAKLDRIAAFAQSLAEREIVAIFRPYHEANGHWFWWAVDRFAEDEKAAADHFWRFWQNTRRYLEEVHGVHNLLYAWSPNIDGKWFSPGTDAVGAYLRGIDPAGIDLFGLDCYSNNLSPKKDQLLPPRREVMLKGLDLIARLQRRFPEVPVGFTELGMRYHEILKNDRPDALMGQPVRGGGTFNQPFFRRFSRWSRYAPHFTIFWRNEPHSLEFPLAGLSEEMDREVVGMYEHFGVVEVDV